MDAAPAAAFGLTSMLWEERDLESLGRGTATCSAPTPAAARNARVLNGIESLLELLRCLIDAKKKNS